ncbi:MAG: threonine--tRNA ligase [Candidatus Lokiarchaeota archaeon]|nr:threonine--tRNA ligase [Candidatus Lokiarchaeota archaeon]
MVKYRKVNMKQNVLDGKETTEKVDLVNTYSISFFEYYSNLKNTYLLIASEVSKMRMLQIHSDGFSFEAKKKAIKSAEKIEQKKYLTKDSCLVNFIAAETSDTHDIDRAAELTTKMIEDAAKEVKENHIIIYPWVHLSEKPSPPNAALKLLKKIEKLLKEKEFDVFRVPFGWYKAFAIHCKGHPLAERSKVLDLTEVAKSDDDDTTEGEDLTALKAEQEAISKFFIMEPDGKMTEFDKFDYTGYEELRLYVNYETAKDRTAHDPPAHIDLMKQLELVDYEPGSDAGNFRWPSRGLTLKRAIEKRVTQEMVDYGAHVLQTPLIYDYQHPALKSYMQRFPSRQYVVRSGNKDYFARFSACFGQFLLISQAQVSYKQLPLKLFEIAPSYRREQSGELAGMRRPRAFTMPDIHEIVSDIEMAKEAVLNQLVFVEKLMTELEIEYEVSFRFHKPFFEENKEFIDSVIQKIGKPVMIEVFEQRYAYFVFKGEWNVVDDQDKAACLGTIQIDVENGERFDITYVDEEGEKKHPLILHTSPSGSIERILYGVLEQAVKDMKKGKKPMLPVWMTPVQVRLVPVDESMVDYCQEIGKELDEAGIRYEIDDRDQTVGKKIRAAEKLWIPYTCVIGDREKESGKLSVRRRVEKDQVKIPLTELKDMIHEITSFAPNQRLLLPTLISKQAIFSRTV